MKKNPLEKKVVLISGASSGIGKAIAKAFAEEGAHLVLGARRVERFLENEWEEITKTSSLFLPLDVRNSQNVEDFVKEAHNTFGRIDILINNAGLALGLEPLAQSQEEDWQTVIDTNVMGVLRLSKAVLQVMLPQPEGGQIMNISSISSYLTYPGGLVYCASKHALRAITQTLRQELLGKPIRVGSISPGMVETEFSTVRFHGNTEKAAQIYQGFQPLTPEDVAQCAIFLANRPPHVNIDDLIINPVAQAGTQVFRETPK